MQLLDTDFLHMFAFLFFRFKPDTYYFVVGFILRNLFIALVPAMSGPILQVFCITAALVTWLTLSAAKFPWRIEKASYLDVIVTAHTIVVLSLSGFFVVKADPAAVGIIA